MAKLGKRTAAAREAFAGKSDLPVSEAVALVKANATAKFDESVEIALRIGVDPKKSDQVALRCAPLRAVQKLSPQCCSIGPNLRSFSFRPRKTT